MFLDSLDLVFFGGVAGNDDTLIMIVEIKEYPMCNFNLICV